MALIKAFYYDNQVDIQIHVDTASIRTEYYTMYNRPIKIHTGIDNPLTIAIKNQDQKPVDMSAYAISVQIQDPLNEEQVFKYDVTLTDATKGIGKFTIPKADIATLDQRIYKLTTKCTLVNTTVERPLFIDDNYGCRVDLQVMPGYY